MVVEGFDIIGDIHGHADALLRLLKKLGYQENDGFYSHSHRKVIFLGDFIDKGKEQEKVINIVKNMVDNGAASAVMGNHEFNAICYHTNDPKTGKPLREHSPSKRGQHEAFLKEYPLGGEKTKKVIDWFKKLPLFLEMDEFRVIHACWEQDLIDDIALKLKPKNIMTDDFLFKEGQRDTLEFETVEVILKGLELKLPEGVTFPDQYEKPRGDIRIKWWSKEATTYHEYAVVHKDELDKIPKIALSDDIEIREYPNEDKPVFFGHYWFTDEPKILKLNVACLDYSVANKEKLVCYRWNTGDKELSNKQFRMVDAID